MDEHDMTNNHCGQPKLTIFAQCQHGIEGTMGKLFASAFTPLFGPLTAKIEIAGSGVREGRLCKMFESFVVSIESWCHCSRIKQES